MSIIRSFKLFQVQFLVKLYSRFSTDTNVAPFLCDSGASCTAVDLETNYFCKHRLYNTWIRSCSCIV